MICSWHLCTSCVKSTRGKLGMHLPLMEVKWNCWGHSLTTVKFQPVWPEESLQFRLFDLWLLYLSGILWWQRTKSHSTFPLWHTSIRALQCCLFSRWCAGYGGDRNQGGSCDWLLKEEGVTDWVVTVGGSGGRSCDLPNINPLNVIPTTYI